MKVKRYRRIYSSSQQLWGWAWFLLGVAIFLIFIFTGLAGSPGIFPGLWLGYLGLTLVLAVPYHRHNWAFDTVRAFLQGFSGIPGSLLGMATEGKGWRAVALILGALLLGMGGYVIWLVLAKGVSLA